MPRTVSTRENALFSICPEFVFISSSRQVPQAPCGTDPFLNIGRSGPGLQRSTIQEGIDVSGGRRLSQGAAVPPAQALALGTACERCVALPVFPPRAGHCWR